MENCDHLWLTLRRLDGYAKQQCSWCPQQRIVWEGDLADYDAWAEEMREAFAC